MDFNATTGIISGIPSDGNPTELTITATNPASNAQQIHELFILDPSIYTAQLELSPTGVLSAQTPHNIAGLSLLLDASEIPEENTTTITSWLDSSGQGRHLDQYRGNPQVTLSEELDNRKVVSFNGYSQLYSNTDFQSILNEYTIIALARHSGGEDQSVIASAGTDWVFGLGESKSAYWKVGSNLITNGPSSTQSWYLLTGVLDNDGEIEFWRDGFLLLKEKITLSSHARPKRFAVGGAGANRDFSKSEVAEVMIYNRALDYSERLNLEDHLRIKWMSNGLENFPLLVRFSQNQHPEFSVDSFADSNNGGDLRILDQKGKFLTYDVDEWNASTGESTVWVKVDKITPDLKLIAYWGNENNTTPTYNPTESSVWPNYAGVWHLSDSTDSSPQSLTTSTYGSPEINQTGVSGYAMRFDGNFDYLTVSNFNAITGSSPRTIETWIRSDQNQSEIISWGTVGNRWNFGWNSQGPQVLTENNNGIRQGTATVGNGQWNHLLLSYPGDGANLNTSRLFLNGRLIDAPSSSTDGVVSTANDSELNIARFSDGTFQLNGWMDETRISTVSRSHAWAKLSFESQRLDKNFLSQDLKYLQAPILPSDLNFTVVSGLPTSLHIQSNPPASYYEINSTDLKGMVLNQATGILSGEANQTGIFYFTLTAKNAAGSSSTSLIIHSNSNAGTPVIASGEVISVMGRSAKLLGELTSTGGPDCTVTIYYGQSDQNYTENAWGSNRIIGQFPQGPIPITLDYLDSGQTYYYRLKAENGVFTEWSDSGSFTTLPYDQGTLRIHTGLDENGLGAGWFWDKGLGTGEEKISDPTLVKTLYFAPDGSSWTLTKAIFSFDESLTLGSNLNKVILEGTNSLSIQVDGDITIANNLIGSSTPLNPHVIGGSLSDGHSSYYSDSNIAGKRLGQGNLGGYDGGNGPGRGISSGVTQLGGKAGGGASFGGEGGSGASGASGIQYGPASLDPLIGGSGGGLGNVGDAGAGGGALELNSSGKILITESTKISLRGGTVFVNPAFGANFSGGAGSGGAIKLIGSTIENRGVLDVRGGDAPGADIRETGARYLRQGGGAGGGGRVALISDGPISIGTVLLEGGKENSEAASGLPGTIFLGPKTTSPTLDLIIDSGTLVFDTAGAWTHTSGLKGLGLVSSAFLEVENQTFEFGICEFAFNQIEIGPEVSVVVRGQNALKVTVNGDATIGSNILLNGSIGKSGIYSGIAGPGGWNSGRSLSNSDFPTTPSSVLSGMGPGGGIGFGTISPSSGGGSFGGYGSSGDNNGSLGNLYGDSNLTELVGGSGGGRSSGRSANAGGGGGAISFVVGGTFVLEANTTISTNGGDAESLGAGNAGAGSGGAIRIEAANLYNFGRLEALGGDTNGSAGPGGGGRITLISPGILDDGNLSVSAGTNPHLINNFTAQDGIYSKFATPSIPALSELNFAYNNTLTPTNLNLISGLDYNLSGLPAGVVLDEDLQLAGNPQRAGTFSVLIKASNQFGEANSTFTINVTAGTPSVNTMDATQVGATSALLHAEVTSHGGEDANLTFLYSQDQNNLELESNISVVSVSGEKPFLLTGLESNRTYYYKAKIENSLGSIEANEVRDFTTLTAEVSPYVRVFGATNITAQSADLHYGLVSYDTEIPELTLYWGTKDQKEVEGLWQSSFEIGEVHQIGIGKQSISGLSPGETYFFRVQSKTANKISWTESAGLFRTIGFPAIEVLPPLKQTTVSAILRGNIVSDGGVSEIVDLESPTIADGLHAHWRFDEGQGAETKDDRGTAPIGRVKGGVTWVPSISQEFGSALSMWGETQSFVDLGSFRLGGGPMSLTGWFKLREYGNNFRAIDFGDDIYGTNSLVFSNQGSDSSANLVITNATENQLGWNVSNLNGDEDSNLSSEYTYTCAVNLHGENRAVNGVTFEGTTGNTGNGWAITSGFGLHVGGSDSTVTGQIGAILDEGFKFSGDPQKIQLNGLNVGQTYRFSMYSQSWSGNRICVLSCSALPGSITVDQDQNQGLNPDGLLVECTYIANSSEVEITIDPVSSSSWHLYAFSNRELLSNRNTTSLAVDSFWNLNQWQHLALTIEEDGKTNFYSDGNYLSSQAGEIPTDLNRSFHVLGGNRLGMEEFNPLDLEGLKLWLDARYGHTVFTDIDATELAAEEGAQVVVWKDLSGNGHDAISTLNSSPLWQPFGFNELPSLYFDRTTKMTIQNSTEEFDGWSKLSVYAVVEEKSINVWSFWFGKSGGLNNTTNSSWHFMSRRPDLNPPRYRFRINGTSGGDTPEINGAFSNLVHDPMILTLIYDGASGKRQAFINGTMVINQSNDTGNIHSTNHPLSIGGKPTPDSWGGVQTNYSEFIVLNHVLNPNQHLELEGFLAHKWSLQEELPENHEYKSSPPVSAAKDFDFFNGEIDDLRIYNRALTNEEINSIYTGDLTEEKHSGGQDPQVTLYWGNEDGGYNLDINSSSPDAWDHKLDLGNIKMGTFSTSIEGLQAGTRYFYRLHAENDAGSQWSPTSGTFSAGSFSFAAERLDR